MPSLVLGPLLRYVDATSATVWVQTDAPGSVTLHAGTGHTAATRTFTVHDCHYALLVLDGLEPGASYSYTVDFDGQRVWPPPDSGFPASRIRTIDPAARLRLVFGSCRTSLPHDARHTRSHGVDLLRSYADRMSGLAEAQWPSVLLLLGDQVYADEPPPQVVEFITARRGDEQEPAGEIADFTEYAELYRQAWSEPAIRWLLSTVPSAMIFDDHDVRDDWNSSANWRAAMSALPWWRRRVVAALGAYWVYQHLGNLAPADLAADPLLAALRDTDGDGGALLDEFAWLADTEPARNRWSYARDYGRTRLVVLDTRCARVLTPGQRAMLDPAEWAWFDKLATGDLDHLVVGSSLPVLLPEGIQQVESWNEAVCDGAWGARAARFGETLRRALDVEHWGAFRRSFDTLATVTAEVADGRRGAPPGSVLFVSGDVHYSYLARAMPPGATAPVYQIVCSPIRNPLNRTLRLLNAIASVAGVGVLGRALARTAGVPRLPLRWRVRRGPFFRNALGTLDLAGRHATLRLETARAGGGDPPSLHALAEQDLT
jgi:hypothetical protein